MRDPSRVYWIWLIAVRSRKPGGHLVQVCAHGRELRAGQSGGVLHRGLDGADAVAQVVTGRGGRDLDGPLVIR